MGNKVELYEGRPSRIQVELICWMLHASGHQVIYFVVSLCFTLLCVTGSFPFPTGFFRFWRWLKKMRVSTAALHPILPGRTSVMKADLLSLLVSSAPELYKMWRGTTQIYQFSLWSVIYIHGFDIRVCLVRTKKRHLNVIYFHYRHIHWIQW